MAQFIDSPQKELDLPVSRLLGQCFPVSRGGSFFDDFPVWKPSTSGPRSLRWIELGEEGDPLGYCGLRLAHLRALKSDLPVGLIGAVATHPDHRGKGLASKLVSQAVDHAQKSGVAMILLWGSEHEFYRKYGFELCGVQQRTPLSEIVAEMQRGKLSEKLRRAGDPHRRILRGWDPRIFPLLKKRKFGLSLDEVLPEFYAAHLGVEWWRSESPKGEVLAYAGVGRGIDLDKMIHEWGGEAAELFDLFKEINLQKPGLELLGAPEVLADYGIPEWRECQEFLALAKILDPSKVLEAYGRGGSSFTPIPSGGWIWKRPGKPDREVQAQELSPLVFNSEPRLPLWVWGLDAC